MLFGLKSFSPFSVSIYDDFDWDVVMYFDFIFFLNLIYFFLNLLNKGKNGYFLLSFIFNFK